MLIGTVDRSVKNKTRMTVLSQNSWRKADHDKTYVPWTDRHLNCGGVKWVHNINGSNVKSAPARFNSKEHKKTTKVTFIVRQNGSWKTVASSMFLEQHVSRTNLSSSCWSNKLHSYLYGWQIKSIDKVR